MVVTTSAAKNVVTETSVQPIIGWTTDELIIVFAAVHLDVGAAAIGQLVFALLTVKCNGDGDARTDSRGIVAHSQMCGQAGDVVEILNRGDLFESFAGVRVTRIDSPPPGEAPSESMRMCSWMTWSTPTRFGPVFSRKWAESPT